MGWRLESYAGRGFSVDAGGRNGAASPGRVEGGHYFHLGAE